MDTIILTYASTIGSIAFALSGWMLGIRKELDIVGLFIIAMLTANGGGAVRDILIGKTPVVLTDPSAFYMVCGVVLIALVLKLHRYSGLERRFVFVISDSIGLVAFSIAGAMAGLEADLSVFGVLVLAFVTATGGGIIRDMFINEVPTLLSYGFYASVALITALAFWVLHYYQMLNSTTSLVVFFFALTLRLVAHFQGWHMPRIQKAGPYLGDTTPENWKN
jgi:uncharacterized membrane protein YeiH